MRGLGWGRSEVAAAESVESGGSEGDIRISGGVIIVYYSIE